MDKNPTTPGPARVAFAALLAVCFLPGWPRAGAQTANTPKSPQNENVPAFKLRVGTNLVVVRVAVRDAHGNPVDNLRQEDFRLFDNGREQSIAQFEVKAPALETFVSNRFHSPQPFHRPVLRRS